MSSPAESRRAAEPRRPAAFSVDDPNVVIGPGPAAEPPRRVARAEAPRPFASVAVQPAAPAIATPAAAAAVPIASVAAAEAAAARPATPSRPVPWGLMFWGSAGGLVVLGLALSVIDLVADLYGRSGWLGTLGFVLAAVAAVAFTVIAGREAAGLLRLKAIDQVRDRAAEALASDDRAAGRAAVTELLTVTRHTPTLERARVRVQFHLNEIIDGRDLVHLAERELMTSLDEEASRLVTNAAKRVSVVTAVSPRAAIDMLFVLGSAIVLVRRLALLYGGRPGALGMARLMRHVVSHLALTGGLSVGDSVVQQMIGQGLAAKVSAKLGEGVLNGLLTARLGLAAIDVTRPLPFSALKRPTIQDLAGSLVRAPERDAAAPPAAARAATAE
ncbi:TIGR01620 family protein [Rhodoplanes serenus]|uniref:TIGR01620 family protein n=1 Tax=Rhodoplanes serenus TaxID=200615 RepID=A0A9X4XN74_9BRAD|nr:TIGR01620 family protein [Rhodoplanes serenus]MTW18237.1 TIGR01620 family protein [Rhodoplanes serenus]